MAEGRDLQDTLEPALADLRRQLSELQHTLSTVSAGGADAVVLGDSDAEQIYTLGAADLPYRILVESMGEGAATVSERGVILYANPQLAAFLGVERASMIGRDLIAYVGQQQRVELEALITGDPDQTARAELNIRRPDGAEIAFLVTSTEIDNEGVILRCLVFTDLTMQKLVEQQLALDAARSERQRVAHEVNDTIVQGLVAAEMALDLGETAQARSLIASTSSHARAWIGDLAGGQRLEPGMAVRSTPARPRTDLP